MTGLGAPPTFAAAVSLVEVRHVTHYRYARPVAFGPHRAMLRPRDSHDLKLRSATLTVSPAAQVSWMHDVFGNSVRLLEFTEPAAELRVESRIELEQFTLDQPAYRLAAGAENWPFAYDAEERRDLGPTLDRRYPGGNLRALTLNWASSLRCSPARTPASGVRKLGQFWDTYGNVI